MLAVKENYEKFREIQKIYPIPENRTEKRIPGNHTVTAEM